MLVHALSILNEAFLIVVLGMLVVFVNPEMPNNKAVAMGNALIGVVVGLIAINWMIIIGYSVSRVWQAHKEKKLTGNASVKVIEPKE